MTLTHNGFLALLPFVREEFVLTRAQVGYYSTSLFLSSAVLAIITGSIVDRVGPKKGLMFGVICLGSMNLLFGFSPSYAILLMLAFIAGVGQSIITPSVNKGVMNETPTEKRAVSMGIMQSGVGIGGLAGAGLLPLLGQLLGWRMTIQIAGTFAILMGFLIYKVYHERVDTSEQSASLGHQKDSFKENFKAFKNNVHLLLVNRHFLLTCLFGIILAGLSVGAVLSHFTVFLSEDLQMDRAAAGLGLGFFQIGGILGRPTWGWLSDRFFMGNRKSTLSVLGLLAGLFFLITGLFFNTPQANHTAIYLFTFVMGFFIFGWAGVYFVAVGELAGSSTVGAATGMALLANRIGILSAPPIFGLIADLTGSYSFSWLLFGVISLINSHNNYRGGKNLNRHF